MPGLPLLVALALSAPLYAGHSGGSQDYIEVDGGDSVTLQDTINTMNGSAFPLTPVAPGVRELKLIPAYLRVTNDYLGVDEELSGYGFAVTYFRGLSRHWGFSLFGGYASMAGETNGINEYASGGTGSPGVTIGGASTGQGFGSGVPLGAAGHRLDKDGFAWQGAAALIFDPLSGDRFRLPFMLGFGGMLAQHGIDQVFPISVRGGQGVRVVVDREDLTFGPILGVSAQLRTGPLRWAPFLTAQFRLGGSAEQDVTVTDAATGQVLASRSVGDDEPFFPSGGITVDYIPWGLSFSHIPNLQTYLSGSDEPVVAIYSLTKRFKWGGT